MRTKITITINTTDDATTQCINSGGTAAPGINKQDIGVSVTTTIPKSEIKNGTLSVSLTTATPAITVKVAGCTIGMR